MGTVIADTPSAVVAELVKQVNALIVDVAAIRTAMTAHTHGGVTTGAGTTSAASTIAALTSATVTVGK